MYDELQQELEWLTNTLKDLQIRKQLKEFRDLIIAKEHASLRALFEKKTGQHLKGLEASGYIKGRNDCLAELQEKPSDKETP